MVHNNAAFNLGGAGGVERLDTWEDTTVGNQRVSGQVAINGLEGFGLLHST